MKSDRNHTGTHFYNCFYTLFSSIALKVVRLTSSRPYGTMGKFYVYRRKIYVCRIVQKKSINNPFYLVRVRKRAIDRVIENAVCHVGKVSGETSIEHAQLVNNIQTQKTC